jgi:tetratricopeptide (TPR) repeat protein
VAALTPVADSDIWWHLSAGREMIRTGAILRSDPFSLGALGRPWIDVHWLFQLASYGGFRAGGLGALVAAKAVLVAAGAVGLLAGVRRALGGPERAADGSTTAGSALLVMALPAALLSARHLLLVRPVILSLVFLALFLWVLERYRTEGDPRLLLALPVAQVVWANVQGLSALGPALVAAYAAGGGLGRLTGRRELPAGGERWLLATLGACLLAGLATPFGLAGALLPLRLLARVAPGADNVFSSEIAENVPPFVLERVMPGQMAPLVAVMLAAALSFLVARPLIWGRVLATLAFAGLALMANRNVLLFFWVALPLAAMNAGPAVASGLARLRRHAAGMGPPAAFAIAVALVATGLGLAVRAETPLGEPAPFRAPEASAQRIAADIDADIAANSGQGRIFAADHYGGYLIWALYPRARPYIDTRLVLRTADEYAEFLGLLDHPERWRSFADKNRFDYLVLPTAYPDRYLGLIQHLHASSDWRLIHTDGSETLFARADSPAGATPVDLGSRTVTDGILDELERRHAGQPEVAVAARLHLARLQLAVGEPDEALHVLEAAPGHDAQVALLRARCLLVQGRTDDAASIVTGLLERDPQLVAGHTLQAIIALGRGRTADALPPLRRALQLDPYDAEARALLDRLEAAAPGR